MHKDDQMTPVERAAALERGEAVDRMPIGITYGNVSARLMGWSRREGDMTARRYADRVAKMYEVFGVDGVGVSYGLHGIGRALGAEMSDPEFGAPAILAHPLEDITDQRGLDLDKLTLEKDPHARLRYDAAQMLLEELGDEVGCGFCVPGVFTAASSVVGPSLLMRSLRRAPEAVHRLLEFVTQGLLQIARPFLEMGVPVNIADPVASGSMISGKSFDEFVLPYAKEFVERCNAIRPLGVSAHICGNTALHLESVVACGYNNFDIDNVVDLTLAKERIGSSIHISGNVDPTGVLLLGTPTEVEEAVKDCFRKAWDSPRGFTINTGCDAVWDTPLENALAFVAAARRCARYPVNPENYQ